MAKYPDYFIFDGQKYYSGTIVKFKHSLCNRYSYGKYYGVGDFFQEHRMPGEPEQSASYIVSSKEREIESIVVPFTKQLYVKKYKDTECSDMFYAWVAYIACMIFFTLTYDRIGWWLLCTVIFLNYRHSQLYVKY